VDLTAEEIKALLELRPHPTCGYVAETYRSDLRTPRDSLPHEYEGDRPFGSALYFLVTPDAQIVLHRIRSDQFYHHYFGDPLEVLML
jgi:predicted cupin superfamily sugar epimerase